MKRSCVLACLVGIFVVPAVQAQMQIVLYQDLNNYSHGDSGEFNAVPSAALLAVNPTLAGYTPATADLTAGSPNFQTFCVETGEYFTPGDTYNVSISDKIKYDGGQFPNGESLTLGAAWLYSQFAAGTLSGYDYTEGSGRITSAGDLQEAIWYLQGEASLVNGSADGTAFYGVAEAALGGSINNAANGAYGVVVLNLWDDNDQGHQDQLMVVPEPNYSGFGLLLLLSLGVHNVRSLLRKQEYKRSPARIFPAKMTVRYS